MAESPPSLKLKGKGLNIAAKTLLGKHDLVSDNILERHINSYYRHYNPIFMHGFA